MAYNIKLFVHGVPNGQDIWGDPGSDAKYIEAFYGRQTNVTSRMLLEIMHFGGETNAYYTYYYSKLQEKGGRAGGYFALTLRINYYYADIQNIYNLLEAAFNKYIIGSVLEYTTGGCRFLVSQLNQANENFMALEKELKHYLMQFSSNTDFISLGDFKSNGQNECSTINLLEAVSNVVSSHVKTTGKISVSALYPTSKEQQIINKMNSEVQAANSNAQQQIAAAQQKAKQEVQAVLRDKEQGIQAIKNEYKDADKTISQLRAQIDKNNKEIAKLNAQVNESNNKLQNAQFSKTENDKLKEFVKKIKNDLSWLSGISSGGSEIYGGGEGGRKPKAHFHGFESFIKKIHPFMDFFVILILLCIIGMMLPKSYESKDIKLAGRLPFGSDKEEVDVQKGQKQVAEASSKDVAQTVTEQAQLSLKERFPNAKIDVSGISNANPMKAGFSYKVSLQNVEGDLNGEWESDDFDIYNEQITPKKDGRCTLYYIVNGDTLAARTISVKR